MTAAGWQPLLLFRRLQLHALRATTTLLHLRLCAIRSSPTTTLLHLRLRALVYLRLCATRSSTTTSLVHLQLRLRAGRTPTYGTTLLQVLRRDSRTDTRTSLPCGCRSARYTPGLLLLLRCSACQGLCARACKAALPPLLRWPSLV